MLFICGGSLFAQKLEKDAKPERKPYKSTMTAENHARSQADGMVERLDLNEAQAAQVLEVGCLYEVQETYSIEIQFHIKIFEAKIILRLFLCHYPPLIGDY